MIAEFKPAWLLSKFPSTQSSLARPSQNKQNLHFKNKKQKNPTVLFSSDCPVTHRDPSVYAF